MPKTKNDPVKMEKKLAMHDKRILGYSLQLQAYIRLIRKVGTIPVLDGNMVNLLQALLDQLIKITDFETFREESELERNQRGRDVSFALACTYCGQSGFASGLHLLGHLLNDPHDGVQEKARKRFKKVREPMTQDLVSFLEREKHILSRHHFRGALLEPLVDFFLLTKTFLNLTSRYLVSLEMLEQLPSVGVGRGVDNLLGQLLVLIEKAHCIESVPHYSTLLFQYNPYCVTYACNGNVFTDISAMLEYFTKTPSQLPPIQGNVFSLPRPPPTFNNGAALFAGQSLPIMTNNNNNMSQQPAMRPFVTPPQQSPGMGRPITRKTSDIRPFATCPPPRMVLFPQPMPFLLGSPAQPMNAFPSPQQVPHHRRMLFNPSTPPPPTPQSPQSPMFQRGPPPGFLLQPAVVVSGNAHSLLPPLNEAGTADQPIFNEYLKRFLESPQLDDLIETGKALCHFPAASLIPSELIRALKSTVPEAATPTIKCFGAKVSGVGYETDNVNLYVDDGASPKTEQSITVLFTALLEYFSAHSGDWVLQNSKLCGLWTHLKVKNCCENVYCQISFDSEPYCANTRLIRYFTGQYPVCQKLCYFVQEFAKLAELNFERNVIVVLVIFYLQMQNVLPSVRRLQTSHDENVPWSLTFNPLPPADLKLKPLDSSLADIRAIARAFFHFYGHKLAPLAEYVLCPYDGQVLRRSDFAPGNEWRHSQPRYRAYLESAGTKSPPERLDVGAPMCVQDLFVLKTNIAGKVSADDCRKFGRLCRMADEFYANNGL